MNHHLEELQLIQASLLPDERIVFLENMDVWRSLLASESFEHGQEPPNSASFQIQLDQFPQYALGVNLDENYPNAPPSLSVKGFNRAEQDIWNGILHDAISEASESEYIVYDVITQVLPRLKEHLSQTLAPEPVVLPSRKTAEPSSETYHVLFTSHHLVSPTKRRNLQSWSHSLSVSGFAKVGYPGLIYAQGLKEDVEELVDNVKAMQWLALRVRFVEPLPQNLPNTEMGKWKEFTKVGEVMEEMKRLGRERFVTEMGIGSGG